MAERESYGDAGGEITPPGVVYNPSNKSAIHFRYIMNGLKLPTHYIQGGVNNRMGAVGYGTTGPFFNEKARPMPMVRQFPHKHAHTEYFILFGNDPDNPDDLGGTMEFWIGEGKEAEPFLITKPTAIVLPPNTVHLPEAHRESRRPILQLVVYDATLWSCAQVYKVHPDFDPEKQVVEKNGREKKYQKCINERDVTQAPYIPAHEGKAKVMFQHDMRHNELAPHYTEINLISGAGIGWGCGDMIQYPEYRIQSLPHIHDVVETYCFFGTDPDNPNDLGGTIEFWIGEGKEAKEYVIDTPTVVLIPPATVHLPLYVREVKRPFVSASVLDTPLWTGMYTDVFPPGFKHAVV